ncbi:MAG TPA: hypothetical protein DEA44_12500 [Firmicutes bacterium]|nr:hypothetical protein [Bacillota bacterium]
MLKPGPVYPGLLWQKRSRRKLKIKGRRRKSKAGEPGPKWGRRNHYGLGILMTGVQIPPYIKED